jgi:YHS domain-containing protein
VLYRAVRSTSDEHVLSIDPVCRMAVQSDQGTALDYDGRTYRFCSLGCVKAFASDPDRYLVDTEERTDFDP